MGVGHDPCVGYTTLLTNVEKLSKLASKENMGMRMSVNSLHTNCEGGGRSSPIELNEIIDFHNQDQIMLPHELTERDNKPDQLISLVLQNSPPPVPQRESLNMDHFQVKGSRTKGGHLEVSPITQPDLDLSQVDNGLGNKRVSLALSPLTHLNNFNALTNPAIVHEEDDSQGQMKAEGSSNGRGRAASGSSKSKRKVSYKSYLTS